MTNKSVSQLSSSASLTGSELFYADNGSTDVKVTADQIKTFAVSTINALTAVIDDTTPVLGSTLDANGFNVQFDDGTGVIDASGNKVCTFKKSTAASIDSYVQIENGRWFFGEYPTIRAVNADSLFIAAQTIEYKCSTQSGLGLMTHRFWTNHTGQSLPTSYNNLSLGTIEWIFNTNARFMGELGCFVRDGSTGNEDTFIQMEWRTDGVIKGIKLGEGILLNVENNAWPGDGSIGAFASSKGLFDDNANEQLLLIKASTAAKNYVTITNANASSSPQVAAAGDDTDVDLRLSGKGAGMLSFGTHSTAIGTGTVSGYITVKDSGGVERKLAVITTA